MEKHGTRTSGWLRRESYRDAIAVGSKVLGCSRAELVHTPLFRMKRNVQYSFGIPRVAKCLEEMVRDGTVEEGMVKELFARVLDRADDAVTTMVNAVPKLGERITENPKIGIEKLTPAIEGFIISDVVRNNNVMSYLGARLTQNDIQICLLYRKA